MNKQHLIVDGNLKKNMAGMFFPLLIASFLNIFYEIVDSFWVGNLLGESALAAQTICLPIMLIFNSICLGLTNGVSISLSSTIGSQDESKAKSIVSTMFLSSTGLSFVISAVCIAFSGGLVTLLNAPAEIFTISLSYMRIRLLSFPLILMYLYYAAVFRCYGNSMTQMLAVLICTIINVVLDPILINIVGINGAAIATVISQTLMVLIMMASNIKKKYMRIRIADYNRGVLWNVMKKAFPSIVQQCAPSVSTGVITSLVASFGVVSIAAFGIAGKMEICLLYPAIVINMVMTTAIAQCAGAGRTELMVQCRKWGGIYALVIVVIIAPVFVVFSDQFTGLFGGDAKTALIVQQYFMIIGAGYLCNCYTNVNAGYLNGVGTPHLSMFLMIFNYCIVRIPLSMLLADTELALSGIWIAVLCSHIVAAVASVLVVRRNSWHVPAFLLEIIDPHKKKKNQA